MNELVTVTATIYRPGDSVPTDALRALLGDLWVFSKPEAKTIWDCVVDPAAPISQIHVLAVHFVVQPMICPDCPFPEGSLLATQLEWEWSRKDAFEGDLGAFYQIVQRRLLRWPGATTIQFIGVYDVWTNVYRDEFGGKDSDVENHFLGELDFSQTLPLSTAALEMTILHKLHPRVYRRITEIADMLELDVAAPVLDRALTNLCNEGLVEQQMDFYYQVTEHGLEAVQA